MININEHNPIVIDCDEVLLDLVHPWVDKLNELYNKDYSYSDIIRYDINYFYGISIEDAMEVLHDTSFYVNVNPIKNAKEAITVLSSNGLPIKIVTSTPMNAIGIKLNKLLFDLNITKENVIFTYDKCPISCSIMIDDNYDNLFHNKHADMKILFTKPWNTKETLINNMVSLSSWGSIIDWFLNEELIKPNETYHKFMQNAWSV